MADHTHPGLLVLHGNRLEQLAEVVFAWLASHPLAPLEQETILVQSNGMAEWFKIELAAAQGICASTTVELPARFVWRAYRAVLGRGAVPPTSPLDKLPLAWRLMRLLPVLVEQPGFEPVRGFLGDGDPARRLQLAQRLADLLDQYQVHRADWLHDWDTGTDRLGTGSPPGAGRAQELPADQRWQPALWRALQATLTPDERKASRAVLHQRFVDALRRPAAGVAFPGLPRRIVLFGSTHIPQQTLEALAALAAHVQVLMAVPNPCRYHWADTIDGRELLRFDRQRQALRQGRDLSAVPLQDMHAHGHPLLSAWGRQCRDFVRQLDAFDDVQAAQQRFGLPRVDLFDDAPGQTLLQQVQAAVRDLLPLHEHTRPVLRADDRSIVFHVAHSAQREVEILHDQLLHLLAHPPGGQALQPRDIVVMVPDIDGFAPAIRSVFGQHPRRDPRHIPWGIADQKARGRHPLLVALETLLRMPQQRLAASQLRDLLDVPALAGRFGITPDELPTLVAWIEGAGVRWGLSAAHRDGLGLGAAGEQNTLAFGLRRMLLGYATGEMPAASGFAGIEPYAEVAGLDARLAGALAELVQTLERWWANCTTPRRPWRWADRLRALLADLFVASDASDRALLAALDDALAAWLQACEAAGFDDPVELPVLREAWLDAVDEPGVSQRFKAGGVTFCTLLPLRAVPFEVVCLLSMNDGDYPRRGSRSDFDLMALPGQARPGDRSRRDDDRQLMLDALLSARRVLYISWAGRSQRDNQPQPPSVLVSQLRDYLCAGWGRDVVDQRSTEHPLQPFSRRYFEPQAGAGRQQALFTYAAEWRAAHDECATDSGVAAQPPAGTAAVDGQPPALLQMSLTMALLASFLRNPVKEFFRRRLQVSFDDADGTMPDDEAFGTSGLERWALLDEVLREARRQLDAGGAGDGGHGAETASDAAGIVQRQLARLTRAGRLPVAGIGQRVEAELGQTLLPMLARWQAACLQHPHARGKQAIRLAHPQHQGVVLDDWLVGLRSAAPEGPAVWIELLASRVADEGGRSGPLPRADKLLAAWMRCLASAACGQPAGGLVIGVGAAVHVRPALPEQAAAVLGSLMDACAQGLTGSRPWPTAVRTGLAFLNDRAGARRVYEGSDFAPLSGEGREACLARLYPDFQALTAQADFEPVTRLLYEPLQEWLASQVSIELLPQPALAGDADRG